MESGWDDAVAALLADGWDDALAEDVVLDLPALAPQADPVELAPGLAAETAAPDPTHLQIPDSVINELQLARDTLQCPLAPHFRQVLEYHKAPSYLVDKQLHQAIGNVAEHYMGSQPKLYASKESTAIILGVDASKLEPPAVPPVQQPRAS